MIVRKSCGVEVGIFFNEISELRGERIDSDSFTDVDVTKCVFFVSNKDFWSFLESYWFFLDEASHEKAIINNIPYLKMT